MFAKRTKAMALVIVGAVAGAVLISPVAAGPNDPATKKFVRKVARNKAQKQAGKVENKLQPQIDMKQMACAPGTVKAYGFVDMSAVGGTFGTAGILDPFNCTGGGLTGRKTATGIFHLMAPGITGTPGERIVSTTSAGSFTFFGSTSPLPDRGISYQDNESEGGAQYIEFQVNDFEDDEGDGDGNDNNGVTLVDSDFVFVIYN